VQALQTVVQVLSLVHDLNSGTNKCAPTLFHNKISWLPACRATDVAWCSS
jgi:hypothetical protein